MTSLTMKRSASKNKPSRSSVTHHQPAEDDSRTNCHQCSRRSESDKMRCSNERLANRECGLRYCKTCIEKHPDIVFNPSEPNFKCPRCEDRCLCAKCRGLRGERPTSPSGHVLKRASKHSGSSRSASNNKSRSPAVEQDSKKKSPSVQKPKTNQKPKRVTPLPIEEKEEDYPEESVESDGEDDQEEFEEEEEDSHAQTQNAPASHAPQLSLDFGTTNLQVIENRPVPLLSQGWHGLDEHLATPDEHSHEPNLTPTAPSQTTALPTPPSSTGRPNLKVIFGGSEQRRSTGTLSGFARSRLFDYPRSKGKASTEAKPRAEVWVRGPADLSGSEASDSEIETEDKVHSSSRNSKGPRRTLSGLAQSFNQDSEEAGSFGSFKPSEAGSTYPYSDSNPSHHEDHTFYGLSSHGPEPWMQHSTHSEEASTAASSTSYLGSHDSDSGAYMNMSMDLDVDLDLRSPSQGERATSDYFSNVSDDAFNRISSPFKPSPFKSDYVYQDPFHQGNYFDYDQPFASSPETTAATSSSGRSSLGELEIGAPWGEALRMSSASISSGSGSGSSGSGSQLSSRHGHSLDLSQSWHSSEDHGVMQLDLEDHHHQSQQPQQQPQQQPESIQSKSASLHQQSLPSSYDIDTHPELAALAFHLLHNSEKDSQAPNTPSGMVMNVE